MDTNSQLLRDFLQKANTVLDRLDAWLPPLLTEPDWTALAYRWQKIGQKGILHALPRPHLFPLKRLCAIDTQSQALIRNTEQFLAGHPANNVLLTGARGTGKSSLVKALLYEYHPQGLRLIEVAKDDLHSLAYLLTLLYQRPEKFIIFCDDLSFETGESDYKSLKTVLDGGLAVRAPNVLVYATSNRRHLMPEYLHDNLASIDEQGEVHPQETLEEKTSLSDRFGLCLQFYPFDQDAYLAAVASWLDDAGLTMDETTRTAALQWARLRGSRSGRVAWQFVCDWQGHITNQ